MTEIRVKIRDFRACGMCGPGTLRFFHKHRDLRRVLIRDGGIPLEQLESIDDAMVAQVAAYARSRHE